MKHTQEGRKEGSGLLGRKEWNAVKAGNGGYQSGMLLKQEMVVICLLEEFLTSYSLASGSRTLALALYHFLHLSILAWLNLFNTKLSQRY